MKTRLKSIVKELKAKNSLSIDELLFMARLEGAKSPLIQEINKYLQDNPRLKHSQYYELISLANGYPNFDTFNAQEILADQGMLRRFIEMDLEDSYVDDYREKVKKIRKQYLEKGRTLDLESKIIQLKRYLALARIKSSVEFVNKLLKQDPTKKILIFSQFVSVQEELVLALGAKSCSMMAKHSQEQRVESLREFTQNSNKKVMVASILAVGTGVDISAANSVIFLDMMWEKVIHLQAEARVYRMSQNNLVNIYYLANKNTMDRLMWESLAMGEENYQHEVIDRFINMFMKTIKDV